MTQTRHRSLQGSKKNQRGSKLGWKGARWTEGEEKKKARGTMLCPKVTSVSYIFLQNMVMAMLCSSLENGTLWVVFNDCKYLKGPKVTNFGTSWTQPKGCRVLMKNTTLLRPFSSLKHSILWVVFKRYQKPITSGVTGILVLLNITP